MVATTGHRNYPKCATVYPQIMMNLEKESPWLYKWLTMRACLLLGGVKDIGLVFGWTYQ